MLFLLGWVEREEGKGARKAEMVGCLGVQAGAGGLFAWWPEALHYRDIACVEATEPLFYQATHTDSHAGISFFSPMDSGDNSPDTLSCFLDSSMDVSWKTTTSSIQTSNVHHSSFFFLFAEAKYHHSIKSLSQLTQLELAQKKK